MKPSASPINPQTFGVSFSIKQCRNFGLEPKAVMKWLIKDAGFRRFRLMSYWNEIEKQPGQYDFSSLDWQLELARRYGCVVALCLGTRQPRWPENHWPDWGWQAAKEERTAALLRFVEQTVLRYRDQPSVISYQLENEALLRGFGERPEVDRGRLRQEYALVKRLDPDRPIIMTTSTSWGIPLRQPIPDIVGFSYYRVLYGQGRYHKSLHSPLLHRVRAAIIRVLHHKPCFIHELQLEPWGPAAIWQMDVAEQDKSMSPGHIATNIALARRTQLYPIDLWGGEWWYWRLHNQNDSSVWQAVEGAIHEL